MFRIVEEADWEYGGDHFCWKSGGDGDNGEALMYMLDVYFEKLDARTEKDIIKAEPCEELCCEFFEMKQKLEDADKVMMQIDDIVKRNLLDARSGVADARLIYGEPFKYEYTEWNITEKSKRNGNE